MNTFIKFAAASVVAFVGLTASAYAGNNGAFGKKYIVTVQEVGTASASGCCNSQKPKKRTLSADSAQDNIGGFERKQKPRKQKVVTEDRKPKKQKIVREEVASSNARPARGRSVACLSHNASASTWTFGWYSGGGRCGGSVRTSDMAKVAAILESGGTVTRIPFQISKCSSGWAAMAVDVKRGDRKVMFNAWSKTCIGKDYATVEKVNELF